MRQKNKADSSGKRGTRKFSVKQRITFWYVAMFLFIMVLTFMLLLTYNRITTEHSVQNDLQTIVDQSVSDVRIYNGRLTIDEGIVDYMDGVNVLVVRNNGLIVTGLYPQDFLEDVPFKADEIRKVSPPKNKSNQYFVYDRKMVNGDNPPVWIRGVASASSADISPGSLRVSLLFLILLPFLTAVAVIGGYTITRRAFLPINRIIGTADNIQAGQDLSKRIELQGIEKFGKDEIYKTAKTFNDMLDRLEASFEMETQFSRDASHELRTPIAIIMNQSQLALENLDDRREVEEAFETILEQSHRMAHLTGELLALARADSNMLQTNLKQFDLSALIKRLTDTMAVTAAQRDVNLSAICPEDVIIEGDPALIERMLENIISNGIKYNKPGGSVEILLTEDEATPVLTVSDTGIGMSKETLPKIWDRFYRADDARTSDDSGSMGLGLSMVAQIAKIHNIQIDVESSPGEGSSFILKFFGRNSD